MMLTGNIFITGGSGTLGNAIVRQVTHEGWDARFTIYSRSELLQAEMRARYPACRYVLGDVRDYDRLAAAVVGHDTVVHAAAMKRIPECEANPGECYATNVLGSANVVRACIAGGVRRCLGISTDKACAAITTYGASKRLMEGLFQAQQRGPCAFTLLRYGNVLASRGSVIPLWRAQDAAGLPLTITDRRMTRFWMSERDAVNLVVAALANEPGTILVPKMGALRVIDMARILFPEARFHETGLRSCEKLHEDLVHPCERATDWETVYVLNAPDGELGHAYTSEQARSIDREDLLAMLEEADVVAA